MGLIEQFILPLFILWVMGLVMFFLKAEINFFWKLISFFIFIVYLFQFFPELNKSYERLESGYFEEIFSWIEGIIKINYFFILILWPILLLKLIYTESNEVSYKTIKLAVVYTLIYWISYILYIYFNEEIVKNYKKFIDLILYYI